VEDVRTELIDTVELTTKDVDVEVAMLTESKGEETDDGVGEKIGDDIDVLKLSVEDGPDRDDDEGGEREVLGSPTLLEEVTIDVIVVTMLLGDRLNIEDDPESELVTSVEVEPGNDDDGDGVEKTIALEELDTTMFEDPGMLEDGAEVVGVVILCKQSQ
jgi:hypothetical protein